MFREGIHFLSDYIRLLTDAAGEEFSLLENGRADFAETERAEDCMRGYFDVIPQDGVRRKKIARTSDGLEFAALFFFWCGFAQIALSEKMPACKPALQNKTVTRHLGPRQRPHTQADSLRYKRANSEVGPYNNPSVAWPSATSCR